MWQSNGYQAAVLLDSDLVATAYSRWPFDVINLARRDLAYASRLLAKDGLTERRKALLVADSLISANGQFKEGVARPPAYLIKEVSGPRIKGTVRVGFVGLTAPAPFKDAVDTAVADMFEIARQVVPEARKQCDILVILVHAEYAPSLKLARENPEADLLIIGDPEGPLFKPREIGKTLVVAASQGNYEQGDIRVYAAGQGRFAFKFRSVELDASVPSDADAEAFAADAQRQSTRVRLPK
jgi:2',3'-cyclic-nucleotide 2'-phosphodiesterase (5'-nucleotidase family)